MFTEKMKNLSVSYEKSAFAILSILMRAFPGLDISEEYSYEIVKKIHPQSGICLSNKDLKINFNNFWITSF